MVKRIRKFTQERHGMSSSRMYRIYNHMIWRCYNPNCKKYPDYGGRGIVVCDDWKYSFSAFYNDMSDGYSDILEIDRIDVDGIYEKANCRWVTRSVNNANKRPRSSKLSEGVSKNHKCNTYRSRISIEGIRYTIGHFSTESEAYAAYICVKKEWLGI